MLESGRARMWSRWWHAVLFWAVLAALVTQLWLVLTGGTDVSSGAETEQLSLGTRLVNLVSYFTIQSNVLVLVAAATLWADPFRDGRGWRVLRLDALLGIAITGLVFETVLAGLAHPEGIAAWINAGLHYVSPWATVVGWALFGPRPRIGWSTVAWAFVWPFAWLAYTFARGAATGWYPYPFLDVTDVGYPVALRNVALVLIVALAIAAILKLLDGHLRWPRRHTDEQQAQVVPDHLPG